MLDTGNMGAWSVIHDIVRSQPGYASLLPDDWEGRILYPALANDKIKLICDDKAFVIWCKPAKPPCGQMKASDFTERGPLTWIVDIFAMPGVPVMQIGREVTRTLHYHAGVPEGQRVLFLRTRNTRVGYCTLQKPWR
jgi:hypothetical protein